MGIIKRHSLFNTIISYLGVGLGYVNYVILFPRVLEKEQMGLVMVLVAMGEVIRQFAMLGVQNTTLRYFPFFNDKSRKHYGFLSFIMLLSIVGTLLSSIVMILFKDQLIGLFAENSPMVVEYYLYLFPIVGFMVFFETLSSYARSLQKSVVPSFIGDLFRRILVIGVLLAYFMNWIGFEQFLALFIFIYLVIIMAIVAYLIYLRQFLLPFSISEKLKEKLPEMRIYGVYSFLGTAAAVFVSRLDIIMLGILIGLEDPAVYTVAFFIGNVIYVPAKSIITVMVPMVADAWKENNLDRIGELYHKSSMIQMIVGGLIFLLIWLNIEGVLYFLPEEYHEGKYVVLIIGLTRLFDMMMGVNGGIIMTSVYYRFNFFSNVLLIVFCILANLWLIPLYDIEGAAIATLAVVVLFNVAKFIFLWVKTGLQPFNLKFMYVVGIFGLVWLGGSFLPNWGGAIPSIIWKGTLIGLVYVGMVYFSKASRATNEFIDDKLAMVLGKR